MNQIDLDSIKSAFNSLGRYKVGLCTAWTSHCCGLLCCGRRHKRFVRGKEKIDERLDVVKLVKTSIDFEVLRKLQMTPKQRVLWRKQRSRAIRVYKDKGNDSADDSDKNSD